MALYTVYAVAQDDEGQRIVRQGELTTAGWRAASRRNHGADDGRDRLF